MKLVCRCPGVAKAETHPHHRWTDPEHHNAWCEDCNATVRQHLKKPGECTFRRCQRCRGIQD